LAVAEAHGFGSNPCSNGRSLDGVDPARMIQIYRPGPVGQGAVLDNSCRYPQMMDDWFINIACTRRVPQRRLNQFVPEIVIIFSSGYEQHRPPMHGGAHSIRSDSGQSCSAWSIFHLPSSRSEPCRMAEDNHEHAPTQTCEVIFCPPKAVDTDCRPNPVERASKRTKKLRAISGASPGGSPVGECRRCGELLPTRRALLQIDVFKPRGNIDRDVPSRLTFAADALGCPASPHPPAEPSGAGVGGALSPDELVQGLGIRLVRRGVPHHPRPLARPPVCGAGPRR
jgi:hypothetical protein